MKDLTGPLRGGWARARSVLGGPRPDEELAAVRRRLRRTRRALAAERKETERLTAALAKVTADLVRTRGGLRNPVPDVVVPPEVVDVIDRVVAERLTYLDVPNLTVLAALVVEADTVGRPGLVVEAGTALGGSAIVMAAAKRAGRPMKVYDAFGMIPPPSDKDGPDVHRRYEKIVSGRSAGAGGDTYYGYREDLLGEVTASFRRLGVPVEESGVDFVEGLFQDTIHLDEPVALAHLDGDWYDSTMTCLERIAPLLVPGGRLVLDDYYAWSGCTAAVDDYFADRPGFRLEPRARMHVVKL